MYSYLFINRICNKRENVQFTSKKCSDFVESYICKRHIAYQKTGTKSPAGIFHKWYILSCKQPNPW